MNNSSDCLPMVAWATSLPSCLFATAFVWSGKSLSSWDALRKRVSGKIVFDVFAILTPVTTKTSNSQIYHLRFINKDLFKRFMKASWHGPLSILISFYDFKSSETLLSKQRFYRCEENLCNCCEKLLHKFFFYAFII